MTGLLLEGIIPKFSYNKSVILRSEVLSHVGSIAGLARSIGIVHTPDQIESCFPCVHIIQLSDYLWSKSDASKSIETRKDDIVASRQRPFVTDFVIRQVFRICRACWYGPNYKIQLNPYFRSSGFTSIAEIPFQSLYAMTDFVNRNCAFGWTKPRSLQGQSVPQYAPLQCGENRIDDSSKSDDYREYGYYPVGIGGFSQVKQPSSNNLYRVFHWLIFLSALLGIVFVVWGIMYMQIGATNAQCVKGIVLFVVGWLMAFVSIVHWIKT